MNVENIITLITALSGLIAAVTSLVVAIRNKSQITALQNHNHDTGQSNG